MEPGHLLHSALTRPTSADARRLKSRHPFVPAVQQLISFSDNNIRAAQWADHQWNAEWADNPTRVCTLIPDTGTHTPGMTLPRAWVRLCPIHRPPHGLHGLTVLDDETTEWLLNTCPEIQRGQAVDKRRTRSNERRVRSCRCFRLPLMFDRVWMKFGPWATAIAKNNKNTNLFWKYCVH